MSRNGSGTYSLPAGNPVVTGTTISSSWANTTLSDIASALTGSVASDGQTPMTGNLQMGSNKITGLAAGTASTDAANYGQITGGTEAGVFTNVTDSALTSGRVVYASTGGLLADSANLTFNGTTLTANALTVTGATALNGGTTLGDASGDALTINSSVVSIPNGLNFDSNTFVIDATNNVVGIGTSNPSAFGTLALYAANAGVHIDSTSGAAVLKFYEGAGTGRGGITSLNGSNGLAFLQGTTEAMRIDSSGNVGIGTSSPDGKLNVAGASLTNGATKYVSRFETTDSFAAGLGAGIVLAGKYNTAGSSAEFGSIMGIKENSTDGNYAGALTFQTRANGASPSERMRLDSSGNLGLGVTPPTWNTGNALFVNSRGSALWNNGAGNISLIAGAYYNSGWKYSNTSTPANRFDLGNGNGTTSWSIASGGTIDSAITFTQAMTLNASGNLGIGTTGQTSRISATGSSATDFNALTLRNADGTDGSTAVLTFETSSGTEGSAAASAAYIKGIRVSSGTNGALSFWTTNAGTPAERMRIDSSGNLLVGTTSGSSHILLKNVSVGSAILGITNSGQNTAIFYATDDTGNSTANAGLWIRKVTSTNRSINAAGTVNASGADYAEYMTKAGDFTIAKGDVVGIDANGKLTNVFTDAVSFCVKSTDPSYVGGDVWFTEDKPEDESLVEDWENRLEQARQTVDRIAFAGQVPVNVTGATAGQYIIPVNDNGSIKGQAVSNPTFEQYQIAVGKVIAIEADGRAKIIVKVA